MLTYLISQAKQKFIYKKTINELLQNLSVVLVLLEEKNCIFTKYK